MDKIEDFLKYLSKGVDFSDEARDLILSVVKIKRFQKGDLLIEQEQEKVLHTYFVLNGVLRSFIIDKNGKEHTVQFAIKNWWISDYIGYYGNSEAMLNVDCITDCTVIKLNRASIQEVFARFPEFETFHRKNLERTFVRLNKRIVNHLQLSARDRYLNFITEYPEMESVAMNYHIASYLGITQQSLSRIRAGK